MKFKKPTKVQIVVLTILFLMTLYHWQLNVELKRIVKKLGKLEKQRHTLIIQQRILTNKYSDLIRVLRSRRQ